MRTYSFIKHPIHSLFHGLDTWLPGIAESYALYASPDKELMLEYFSDGTFTDANEQSSRPIIQKFRKTKGSFNWLRKDMLYFLNEIEIKSNSKQLKQLSLTDEASSYYLCLKFLSPYDNLYDALVIKMDTMGVFEMTKVNTDLSAQQRNMVGKLLYQTLKFRLKEEYGNLETHVMVLNNISLQRKALNELQEDNDVLRVNYQKSVLFFINNVLKRMTEQFTITVALSDKAKTYLLSKDLPIEVLEKTIVQASHMAANLSLSYSSTIVIEPENILVHQNKDLKIKPNYNSKHSGIIDLLDRYETAAKKAKAKEWKINGTTVAQLCNPPVTPAAITFNLKKHQKAINVLIDQFDEKWPLLRSEFKPFKNVVHYQVSEISKIKTA